MVIIHELASKKIIPLIKGLLVHKLYSMGLGQRRIAELLGITQPQVHKYLKRGIDYYYEEITRRGLDAENIQYYISLLASLASRGDTEKFIVILNGLVHDLAMKLACREGYLPESICINGRLSDPSIEYYREWLRRITSIEKLYRIIPEVGSNIVYAPYKPRDHADIIGLTGRIIRVSDSIRIVGEPMYGGSRHLARVLLIIAEHDPGRRVAMNISYNRVIEELGGVLRIAYTGPHNSIEEFWDSIERVARDKPYIIVDRGGYGLEPNTYVVVEDFEKLYSILSRILEMIK
jgi:predicted fused transcriptional regulator/phosphomethylpyrimidine kinase/predicted transcriptional regulator